MTAKTDTIAAVSTPAGKGGIGIVRISGPEAVDIARTLFRPCRQSWAPAGAGGAFKSHRLYYGHVVDPGDESPIDEVLMACMKAPHSYTREDVVEFQAHGGPVVLGRILEVVLRSGARLADAGEFTRRAFLSGRIDLSQAEAVADLIEARTESARKLAGLQLAGALGKTVEAIRDRLRHFLVRIEAGIDFPEEVDDEVAPELLAAQVEEEVRSELERLLEGVAHGRVFRDGLKVGLVGRPNVGKSSLMNRLIEQERVIVTEVPGTTRDTVEECIDIHGIPVSITDTAGLQESRDPVERLGVKKSLEIIENSDLVLFIVEAGRPASRKEQELFGTMPQGRTLLVVNKIDLCPKGSTDQMPEEWRQIPCAEISALYNRQIDALKDRIAEMALGDGVGHIAYGLLPNLRHKMLLEKAAEETERCLQALREKDPLELAAISVKEGMSALDRILGHEASADILDDIFRRFCIGK